MQHDQTNSPRTPVSGSADEQGQVLGSDVRHPRTDAKRAANDSREIRGDRVHGSTNVLPLPMGSNSYVRQAVELERLEDAYSLVLTELAGEMLERYTREGVRARLADFEHYMPVTVINELKEVLNLIEKEGAA